MTNRTWTIRGSTLQKNKAEKVNQKMVTAAALAGSLVHHAGRTACTQGKPGQVIPRSGLLFTLDTVRS